MVINSLSYYPPIKSLKDFKNKLETEKYALCLILLSLQKKKPLENANKHH